MELPHVQIRWTRIQPSANGSRMLCCDDGERTFRLIFCLDGRVQAHQLTHKTEAYQQINSGCCGLLAAPCRCCCLACATRATARVVNVQYMKAYLRKLLGTDSLRETLEMTSAPEGPLQVVTKITPSMSHVLRLMEDHIVQGRANPLFVKAKSLELLWLFLAGLDTSERHSIHPEDREAVRTAQGFLETNMAAAPHLAELAAHVGMSVSKLKQLFPRVCGLTPYAYLRQARMEQAMYLLHHAGMNVTETALEVGYASPSRFSRAFAEHFGFNPSHAKQTNDYRLLKTGDPPGGLAVRNGTAVRPRAEVAGT
jgi:AraC-like DNA-binding protein